MSSSLLLRRLVPLAIAASVAALGAVTPAAAQSGDRYDDRPAAAGRDYRDNQDRDDDDRDEPPRDVRRGGDSRDYDGRTYDTRDDRPDDGDRSSADMFYDELEQYGRWVQHPRFGEVWVPGEVGRSWRPYTRGSWTFTDEYGWYWSSSEPWGWATYHYGRWAYDDRYGWVWVPGDEWAPAWVSWRYSDEFVGWAPLPPGGARYSRDDDDFASSRYAYAWILVPSRFFLSDGLHRHVQPASEARTFLSRSRAAGAGPRGGSRGGIDLRTIERLTQRTVTPSRVAITDNRRDPGITKPSAGSITVYRPRGGIAPGGAPSRFSRPQGAQPPAAAQRSQPPAAAQHSQPPAAGAPAVSPDAPRSPGGFERRRPNGTPPPAAATSPPPASSAPAPSPAPAAPPPAAKVAPPPAPPAAAPPQDHVRPNGQHRPPPPPQSGPPVQPSIINQPPPRPAPPAAAAPPKPAPPPAAAAQQKQAPPAKDQKGHEHKKDGDQPPAK